MRRLAVGIIVACSLFQVAYLACAMRSSARSPQRAPLVDAENPRHDFGRLVQGERVEHVFHLINRGSVKAHLREIRTTCDCVAPVLTRRDIPPGGSADLAVTYSARTAEDFQDSLFVYVGDLAEPLELEVRGTVLPLYAFEPPLVDFGRVKPGERASRAVLLRTTRAGALLQPQRPDPRSLAVAATAPTRRPDATWKLELVAVPVTSADRLTGAVLVATGNPLVPTLRLRVRGTVAEP